MMGHLDTIKGLLQIDTERVIEVQFFGKLEKFRKGRYTIEQYHEALDSWSPSLYYGMLIILLSSGWLPPDKNYNSFSRLYYSLQEAGWLYYNAVLTLPK